MPLQWIRGFDLFQEVRPVPEKRDRETLEDEDYYGGDGEEKGVGTEDVEGNLEGTTVHGEDAAVEEEYGDFDETKAGTLKQTDYVARLEAVKSVWTGGSTWRGGSPERLPGWQSDLPSIL